MEERLIYSNIDNGYDFESYIEYCEDMDIEPCESECDEEYYDWLNDMIQLDWEDLLDNIKYSENNGRCLVEGVINLWDGSRTIKPKVFDSLCEAIERINSEDYIEVYETDEEGCVVVKSIHHDGTNVFTIRPICENLACGKSNDEIEDSESPMWFTMGYPKYIY